MVNNDHISVLFAAAVEAVEEAIVNALLAGRERLCADLNHSGQSSSCPCSLGARCDQNTRPRFRYSARSEASFRP